jgi:AraC-like DNA-binding protein
MDWRPGYREVPPPAWLRPWVACVWARVIEDGAEPVLVLPDACADLIWEHGQGVYVAGPDTGPAPSAHPPGTVLAGVRFLPGAAGAILGMPASELLNQRAAAADLGPGPVAPLAAVPGDAAPDKALRLLARVVAARAASAPADPLATAAARMLAHPRARVEDVAGQLGVSERQLRRRCQAAVGYGPATLRRVLRFRRFVSRLDARADAAGALDRASAAGLNPGAAVSLSRASAGGLGGSAGSLDDSAGGQGRGAAGGLDGGAAGGLGRGGLATVDLAEIAADLGFSDQAHLTRETVRLAGLTPCALAATRGAAAATRGAVAVTRGAVAVTGGVPASMTTASAVVGRAG